MRIALAAILISLPGLAQSSLTGAVVDGTNAYVVGAFIELDSGTGKYQVQTNDAGVFEFLNLPSGQYTLAIRVPGFQSRAIKSIRVPEQEKQRLPDVPLDVSLPCGRTTRDLVLLPAGTMFGRLTGSVNPPAAGVEVTLVCRTFRACSSTRTDSSGHFSFEMLSAGAYGLNFRRGGFYPVDASGYSYEVNAGWESVYDPQRLDRCLDGNCDPRRRPKPPLTYCE